MAVTAIASTEARIVFHAVVFAFDMKCLRPKLLYISPRYEREPVVNELYGEMNYQSPRTYKVYVPCGKCEACVLNKRNEWLPRLLQEFNDSDNGYFLTLTYDDENIPKKNGKVCFDKHHIQCALKRLRHHVESGFKYFVVCEYGSRTGRPHYHCLFFNIRLKEDCPFRDYFDLLTSEMFWPYGFVQVSPLNGRCITYTCKYLLWSPDDLLVDEELKPFMVCSKGIGIGYLTKNRVRYHKSNLSKLLRVNGRNFAMPRYYFDKIFDDEERYILFLNMIYGLDKTEDEIDDLFTEDEYDEIKKFGLKHNVNSIRKRGKL